MLSSLRTRASVVWFVLALLTVVSWALGTDHGLTSGSHLPASLVIIVVALVKVRMVGMYFMELRCAPIHLRVIFESYCVAVLVLLVSMYVFA